MDDDAGEPTTAGSDRSEVMRRADTANGERVGDETVSSSLKVLVAVDESDVALHAARKAHELFGDRARYLVLNVGSSELLLYAGGAMAWGVPYPLAIAPLAAAMPSGSGSASSPDVPSTTDRAQAEARSVSTAAGLPLDALSLGAMGDPVERILQVAHDESIDVIVVGSGSGGWWRHLFDPSVSKAVVRAADRPVLVVP
jgi:nucleotide-binding universal stress UspA family protein